MKLHTTTTTLETIGTISDESQFKMRTSQKAFQILSSLYSDKPLAIVRELGCNAMDSHIASNQSTRPIFVHAPNALEPWLTIQDFGTGISHENIYEIYSVYFASTKTNTNSQVGMLGLGSKSPFCYTDNFTITSIHEKVKRVYNAYFNKDGMPTISLASQESTTDGNGVAIQIPIKSSDIGDFNSAIHKAFQFFNVKPTIVGNDIQWKEKPQFEGTFWKSMTGLHQSYAVMGGVAYPIDTYKVHSDHYDIVRKAGLVIEFKIGELDVTPSRESLMYHDWVIKALNDKLDLVKKDFVAKVEDQIKNSPNLLDASKAIYMLNNQWSFLNSSLINQKVLWKGIDISNPRDSIKKICQNTLKSYSKQTWGRSKWRVSEFPALENNALWYVNDLKKGTHRRIISFVRGHSNSNIMMNVVDQAGMNELVKKGFPVSEFIPTSTLPVVNVSRKGSGGKSGKPKGVISLYDYGYNYRQSWESEPFDLASGTPPKYFVIKNKDSWLAQAGTLRDINGNAIATPETKSSLSDIVKFLGIKMDDVRMVSQNNAKYLEALGSKNLADVINKKKVSIDSKKVSLSKLMDVGAIRNLVKHKKFQALSNDNAFKKTILEFNQILEDVKQIEAIREYFTQDEKIVLTFPSKMVELMYLACGSWQVGVERVMNALSEQEQNS